MVNRMDTMKLYDLATDLAQAITESETYQSFQTCQAQLMSDSTFLNLQDLFMKAQSQFEEVSRFGQYHPDYNRVKKDYQEAKINLMAYEPFRLYKTLEKELDQLVFSIENAIQTALGISNKHKKQALKYMY